MATGRENLFDAVLVKDLMNKVKGKSSLAVLSGQTPIPFNGLKEFIFSSLPVLIFSQNNPLEKEIMG